MHNRTMLMSAMILFASASAAWGQCTPEERPAPLPLRGVQALTSYHGELVVSTDTVGTWMVARWDGAAWRPFGAGLGRIAQDLIEFNGDLYASGTMPSKVMRWTGAAWQQVGTGFAASGVSAEKMAVYHGELIVAGKFTKIGSQTCNNIARWDGAAWQPLGLGCNKEVVALTVYNDELIAGGLFQQAGGQSANFIAAWDGSSWRSLGAGADSTVAALAVQDGDLIAGGTFRHAGGQPANFIARYDGSAWSDIGGGVSGPQPQPIVAGIVPYRGQLIITGIFHFAGGVPAKYAARWTGSEWVGFDGFITIPGGVCTFDGDIYIGGYASQPMLRRFGCPPCAADVDEDGRVDFTDYLAYVNLFDAGDAAADLNGDGVVDSADWLVFFDAYSAGCP